MRRRFSYNAGRHCVRFACAVAVAVSAGCVTQQPATDVAESIAGPTPLRAAGPTGTATPPVPPPTPAPGSITIAYTPDMAPIFQADCVQCHSGSRPAGNYSMSTYAQVMRGVVAGNARSRLVVTTQRNASMYRYWRGDAPGKAALVRSWVVDNGAAAQR